jgi:hypothetical protein
MPLTTEFTVEYICTRDSGAAVVARPASPRALSMPATPPATQVVAQSTQSVAVPCGVTATPPEFITPLEDDEERLDAAYGETPMCYRTYDNIVGTREPVPGLAARNLIEELNLASTRVPCTFAEAEQDAAW